MNVQYQQTGNQIHLPMDEMMSHVLTKLEEYDELKTVTQSKPNFSPYTDPIIYITVEGKTVEIPKYIQEKAIEMYKKNKFNKKKSYKNTDDGNNDQYMPSFETDFGRGLGYINEGHIGPIGSPVESSLVDNNDSDNSNELDIVPHNLESEPDIPKRYPSRFRGMMPPPMDPRLRQPYFFDPRLNSVRDDGNKSQYNLFYIVVIIIILMFGFYLYKDYKK